MIRNDRAYQTALRERDGIRTAAAQRPNPSNPAPAVQQPEGQGDTCNREQVMRIRYSGKPDSKGFARLLNFLAYFHGNMPVEILFESDKSITRLDDICRISPEEAVLGKLAELVGADNIEIL